jgi:protein-histidine N-methyltransferase
MLKPSHVSDPCLFTIQDKLTVQVGCGTALPSCFLLSHLMSPSAPPPDHPTIIHVQDYNRPVLSLVSLPNLLLAALPHLPVETLRSADEAGDIEDVVIDYEHGGDIIITPELKAAFMALLHEKRVDLRFTYGHWAGLAKEIEQDKGYELVMTAETIYSEASVDSLIRVLRAANVGEKQQQGQVKVGLEDGMQNMGVDDQKQGKEGRLTLKDGEGVILVAAKVRDHPVCPLMRKMVPIIDTDT